MKSHAAVALQTEAPAIIRTALAEAMWDGLQRWLLRAGAVLLPLAVVWDAFDQFVLPKLLLARLFAIALALVLLARGVMTGRWAWRRTALDIPLLAFLASTVLSTIFAVNRNVAVFGVYLRYEGLLTIITYAAIFWLTVQLLPRRDDARDLGRAMLVGACLVSVIAVYLASNHVGARPETIVGSYVRAFGSLGNPVELGSYLAMLLPFALSEVIDAPTHGQRLLPAAAFLVLGTTLLLTFTRAALAAAAIGLIIVLVLNRPRRQVLIGGLLGLALVGLLVVAVATGRFGSGSLGQALGSRVTSPTTLSEGSIAARLQVWSDSIKLLGLRPVFGSGPDTFGLVYPSVQTTSAPGIDKAHNDLVQVAVTNGLVGVVAYYLLVVTVLVELWQNRRIRWVAALFAGVTAYYVALQAEFSWVPAALPFWLFAAIAFRSSGPAAGAERAAASLRAPRWQRAALAGGIVIVGLALAYIAVVPDLFADRFFAQGVHDLQIGNRATAAEEVAWARQLNPHESLYAIAAGELALNLTTGFRPGLESNLAAARAAFENAVQLGTDDPVAYRGLAIAAFNLGDRATAVAAARRAAQLNRGDFGNQVVLHIVEESPLPSR